MNDLEPLARDIVLRACAEPCKVIDARSCGCFASALSALLRVREETREADAVIADDRANHHSEIARTGRERNSNIEAIHAHESAAGTLRAIAAAIRSQKP